MKTAELIRILGRMRSETGREDLRLAYEEADRLINEALMLYRGLLRRAGQHMLAGRYAAALRIYLEAIKTRPAKREGYLHVIRLLIFAGLPPLRKSLFRGSLRRPFCKVLKALPEFGEPHSRR